MRETFIIEINGPSGVGKSFIFEKIKNFNNITVDQISLSRKESFILNINLIRYIFFALYYTIVFSPQNLIKGYQIFRIIINHIYKIQRIKYSKYSIIVLDEGIVQKALSIVDRSKNAQYEFVFSKLKSLLEMDGLMIIIKANINVIKERKGLRNSARDQNKQSFEYIGETVKAFEEAEKYLLKNKFNVIIYENNNAMDSNIIISEIKEIVDNYCNKLKENN